MGSACRFALAGALLVGLLGCSGRVAHGAPAKIRAGEGPFAGPGYRITLPAGWEAEVRSPLAVTFSVPGRMAIDAYTQPLRGKTAEEYIEYSNRYVEKGVGGIQLLAHRRPGAEGRPPACPEPCRVEEYVWTRPPVDDIDFNYYREVNVVRPGVVYTFVLRTRAAGFDQYSQALDAILGTLLPGEVSPARRTIPASVYGDAAGVPDPNPLFATRFAAEPHLEVRLPERGLMWGIFDGNAPYDLRPLERKEAELGVRFNFVMTYRDFTKPFPGAEVAEAARQGRLTMVTWQPWYLDKLTDPLLIPEIAAGKQDDYIRRWALAVKAVGQPVLLRFANEMNGDWDPWSVYFYGFDHSLYIKAWRRIHDIFQEAGARNAMWVWNPHDRSYPDFAWNDPHLYYPGDDYVDWVGLTGYNTGPRAGDPWRSFDEIYGDLYREYRALYPHKPMLITEFASDEYGGDKAAWIRDTARALQHYPAIKMAVWFDSPWWKWAYQIDSSPAARKAFGEALRDPYFSGAVVRWARSKS